MIDYSSPKILKKSFSKDGSIKYLFRYRDGALAESVYFEFNNEKIVCVSSQLGCIMQCEFCASGSYSFRRNFTYQEILDQVTGILFDLNQNHQEIVLDSVSIQGTGEPLLNFQNIKELAEIIKKRRLAKYISVSTTGIPKFMKQLTDTKIDKLFISLHATQDETRRELIKNTKFCDINNLLINSRKYAIKTKQKVIASYLMIKDINDTDDDLKRLKELLDPNYYVIQLCTLNSVPNVNFERSTRSASFCESLKQSGFESYILESLGQDAKGGCGQMLSIYEDETKS